MSLPLESIQSFHLLIHTVFTYVAYPPEINAHQALQGWRLPVRDSPELMPVLGIFTSIILQHFNTNKILDMQLSTGIKNVFGGAIYSCSLKWYRLCQGTGFGWHICARMGVPKLKGQQVVIFWAFRNVSVRHRQFLGVQKCLHCSRKSFSLFLTLLPPEKFGW